MIAAHAHGDLLAEEQAGVEHHLAHCDECRSLAASVAAEVGARSDVGSVPRRRSRRWQFLAYAAAAVLVVGIGVALFLGRRGADTPRSTDELLASTARELGQARPDLFAGLAPLSAYERRMLLEGRNRGGDDLALLLPAGTVLEPRPTFRWSSETPVERWKLKVARLDGVVIVRAESASTSLDWPKDAPDLESGTVYRWTVADASGGAEPAGRVFQVAGPDVRRAFEEAVRVIDASHPAPLARLLEAHLAYRKGYLARAESAAAAAVAAAPGDATASETLAVVRKAMGLTAD